MRKQYVTVKKESSRKNDRYFIESVKTHINHLTEFSTESNARYHLINKTIDTKQITSTDKVSKLNADLYTDSIAHIRTEYISAHPPKPNKYFPTE